MIGLHPMQEVDLGGVDLNLLVALQALLEEQSVTRAAERMGSSQPAMSRTLGRLRSLFDDPLLVQSGRTLVMTPRAAALAAPLRDMLARARSLLAPGEFDPAAAEGTIRIAMVDYQSLQLLPRLIPHLRKEAPGITVTIIAPASDLALQLAKGDAEFAIHTELPDRADIHARRLFRDGFTCVLRRESPAARGVLSAEEFANLDHCFLTVTGRGEGEIDACLGKLGLRRRIVLRLPHFLAAPLIVARTDLVLTLPRYLARELTRYADVVMIEPPFDLPEYELHLLWPASLQHDARHAWFRRLLVSTMRAAARGSAAGA